MNTIRSSLPFKEGLLDRPRVHRLLEQATHNALVTVVAGPGYGKTNEVARFAKNARVRLIWMHISRLDNLFDHFWDTFVHALEEELPDLAGQFRSMGFPDNPSRLDSFLHKFADAIYNSKQLIFVVDDYGNITSDEIVSFFEYIIAANLENFSLILISAAKTDIGLAALRNGSLYQITAADLKFTAEETKSLFRMYGLELSQDKLNEIEREVGGWPMPLYLLSQRIHAERSDSEIPGKLNIIDALFEKEFFSAYSIDMKKLLIKLSLIHSFSFDIVKKIGVCDIDEAAKNLKSNIFVALDYSSKLYTFQNMYRAFLADKHFMLSNDEKHELWLAAGETFLSLGYNLEAIDCFENCGKHDMMLTAIANYAGKYIGYSKERGNFFLRKLEALPDDFIKQHPLAAYLKAVTMVNNLDIDRAMEIFRDLEKTLPERSDTEAVEVLGEVYWMLGGMNMFSGNTNFLEYFKRSSECLPNGSTLKPRYLHIGNYNIFRIGSNLPGAIEQLENVVHETMPYFVKVAKGGGNGIEHLFSAEAGYFTFDLNAAKRNALKAIYAASDSEQHDILCNARIILARTALLQGNYHEFVGQIEFVRDYIDKREISSLYDLRDCALARLYLAVGDYNKIAPWIVSSSDNTQNISPILRGCDQIIYAKYLSSMGKYDETLPLLEHLITRYKLQGRWIDVLNALIMHAVTLLRLGETSGALSSLWQAYDMSWQNNIIVPFIEEAGNMRNLMEAARKSSEYDFDKDWVDDIYGKSSTYVKRLSLIINEYRRIKSPVAETPLKLSKRETDVLRKLSQGLTREEIADTNYISVNTVKSTIKSLYNKLGAVNRADAVRIATNMGILN
ncbi:MAG: LuxR C-terminal-related transcriptional regulator [Synergistaceae bacterium]|jgi:LuxR family maltose regulon positive regulatory protein|nr:LuxR C-terminal-related transcriptional regulator [Synergistaceae bacterium]